MRNLNKLLKRNEVLEEASKKRILLEDLKEGHDALIKKASTYLPQTGGETYENYRIRLSNSTLYNMLEKTINSFAAKPFKKSMEIDSKNELVANLIYNIDGCDTSATDFFKAVLAEGLWFSQAHTFVDYDSHDDTHTLSMIDFDNILDFDYKNNELVYLRLLCYETVRIDYEVYYYKVVKEYYKNEEDGKIYWNDFVSQKSLKIINSSSSRFVQRVEDEPFYLDYIPLISFYPVSSLKKFNPDLIFQNVAELQISHFKTLSKMKDVESVVTTPVMFIKGVNVDSDADENGEEKKFVMNSKSINVFDSEQASMQWVSPPQDSLSSLRENLKFTETQINDLLQDILNVRSGNTATQATINQSNNNNFLSAVSVSLVKFIEKNIDTIVNWYNFHEVEYSINLTTDFNITLDSNETTLLTTSLTLGVISQEDYFNECKRRGIFADDLVWKIVLEHKSNQIATPTSNFNGF